MLSHKGRGDAEHLGPAFARSEATQTYFVTMDCPRRMSEIVTAGSTYGNRHLRPRSADLSNDAPSRAMQAILLMPHGRAHS
jgi:hypothetical protein